MRKFSKWLDGFIMSVFDTLEQGQFVCRDALIKKVDDNQKNPDWFAYPVSSRQSIVCKALRRLAKKRYIWGAKRKFGKFWYSKRFSDERRVASFPKVIEVIDMLDRRCKLKNKLW